MGSFPLGSQPIESHPWLRRFTLASIVMGIIAIGAGLVNLQSGSPQPGSELGLIVLGSFLVLGGQYILRSTDGYRKWSRVPWYTRLLATIILIPGIIIFIGLFLLPFVVIAAMKSGDES